MLKRLIEVALPLKEVSEQSAREKSIRHGHISTLHIWWARKPLATCRAAVFAALIPDPDDTECPESFRILVNEVLGASEYKPKNGDGSAIKDSPRNRCLEFIKQLVKWENANNAHYIEPARKLIAAAHRILHLHAESEAPTLLDPFAGGGAIPLEALRLGCKTYGSDLNPVAHLIELCTAVFPQNFGQPGSRPVPEYVTRLCARTNKNVAHTPDLFEKKLAEPAQSDEFCPDVALTEAEYRKNPLGADVKYWGHWVLEQARRELGSLYPPDADGTEPVAYLWARTVHCPNPICTAVFPLLPQLWLCKKAKRKIALGLTLDAATKSCRAEICEGKQITFDPNKGTMHQGKAACPFCESVLDGKLLRSESKAKRMGHKMMAVVVAHPKHKGKTYRAPTLADEKAFGDAVRQLEKEIESRGKEIIPTEAIPCYEPRRVSPPLYGLDHFVDLFNQRQLLLLATFARLISTVFDSAKAYHDLDYARAICTLLALVLDWMADKESTLARWHTSGEKISGTFNRQAIGMTWNFAEVNPFCGASGGYLAALDWSIRVIKHTSFIKEGATLFQASATSIPVEDEACHVILTDPPYYDAVPYSILSDFFYIWLRRTVGKLYPDVLRVSLTPKNNEILEQRPHKLLKDRKDKVYFEKALSNAFCEIKRVSHKDALLGVMFAHKSTAAWESLIESLLRSGWIVTSSWPLHTEMKTRMVAQDTAALAGSVTLTCRMRQKAAGDGLWDEVRKELKEVGKERLDFFWSQGIRGADFFISAIGPALSVFGKYERVTKLTGDEVTVGQFLDEVRGLVTNYALHKIMKTTQTANIDPESRFYVIWKWSYGDGKVPADESFKLAQALGIDTELMWDRTGVLEKSGENVQAVAVAKRMKIKNLGEPDADAVPASLIDVLHRMCVFRDKGDTEGMTEFLARSRQGRNPTLWLVAQAISEILPDGDKEKQLMQGLLNQRDQLDQAQLPYG